ncbi:hypothetical protein A3F45_04725 [Candidatus Curtissbacteria bacterium RIFCSPHIGHO2_12_FULL_41_17]|uniref:Uncharacterized protein n=2 Tax=Candidatus Curtissiibacteriota TaxID=1752717 RepID=A0A1F5HIN9_9BACT|nr:MAG: hypothetical protein A2693_01145 [Candidatus Curtissbacteria bacterium RIFCSPHIGHO2_01_FULL_40_12]OGE03948.1 MAG: hypothetical protein A3F45_04725 [Candidatus Curtissbacteria bacterium RIFCSPHIGHO2_12_FULL_41_17]
MNPERTCSAQHRKEQLAFTRAHDFSYRVLRDNVHVKIHRLLTDEEKPVWVRDIRMYVDYMTNGLTPRAAHYKHHRRKVGEGYALERLHLILTRLWLGASGGIRADFEPFGSLSVVKPKERKKRPVSIAPVFKPLERRIEMRPGTDKMRQFVQTCFENGIHTQIFFEQTKFYREQWRRNVLMLVDYLWTDMTYEEVGVRHGMKFRKSKQGTQAIESRLKRSLLRMAERLGSDGLDVAKGLSFAKERSNRTKDRISKVKGGVRLKVMPLARSGATRKEIAEKTGLSPSQVTTVLYAERAKGNLPKSRANLNWEAAQNLRLATTDTSIDEKEKWLCQLSERGLRDSTLTVNFREFCRSGNLPYFIPKEKVESLLEVLKNLGFANRTVVRGGFRKIYFLRADMERAKGIHGAHQIWWVIGKKPRQLAKIAADDQTRFADHRSKNYLY